MNNKVYFEGDAIGSSLLANVVIRIDPLKLSFDRAALPVRPTPSMEMGKQFEDWIEQQFSGNPVFDNKYFKSDIKAIPEYKGNQTDIKQILEILDMLDSNNKTLRENIIQDAYIYTDKGKLHQSYKQRHRCLDQIAGHDFRRPIPLPGWEKLLIMSERFKNYPFRIGGLTNSLEMWINSYVDAQFQVEHFWTHSNGAKCRGKFDMIWIWTSNGNHYALPFDIKVTADGIDGLKSFKAFQANWRKKYIWQSKHYIEGFKDYCHKNGLIPSNHIWYIIQESEAPQITHARSLSYDELAYLSEPYNETLLQTQRWIDNGKPFKGYIEQEIVDRWGNPV